MGACPLAASDDPVPACKCTKRQIVSSSSSMLSQKQQLVPQVLSQRFYRPSCRHHLSSRSRLAFAPQTRTRIVSVLANMVGIVKNQVGSRASKGGLPCGLVNPPRLFVSWGQQPQGPRLGTKEPSSACRTATGHWVLVPFATRRPSLPRLARQPSPPHTPHASAGPLFGHGPRLRRPHTHCHSLQNLRRALAAGRLPATGCGQGRPARWR